MGSRDSQAGRRRATVACTASEPVALDRSIHIEVTSWSQCLLGWQHALSLVGRDLGGQVQERWSKLWAGLRVVQSTMRRRNRCCAAGLYVLRSSNQSCVVKCGSNGSVGPVDSVFCTRRGFECSLAEVWFTTRLPLGGNVACPSLSPQRCERQARQLGPWRARRIRLRARGRGRAAPASKLPRPSSSGSARPPCGCCWD